MRKKIQNYLSSLTSKVKANSLIKKDKKWFTLVELIVVITVLTILGTIAFISFQWITSEARDTKRISDLRSLISALETKRAWNSIDLLSFVDDSTTAKVSTGVYIAWKDVTFSTNEYNAWIIKSSLLWVSDESIKDPNGSLYSFWATKLKNWQYQFAATLENWEEPKAFVIWNYTPRTISWSTVTWVVTARDPKTFKITSNADFSKLLVWDIVTDWTGSFKITSISSDLTLITVDNDLPSETTTLKLVNDEVGWLIWDYNTETAATSENPVTNKSTTILPY